MADELPPGTPEVDDPLIVADLIQLLSIKGAIGKMRLLDVVLPVVSLGDVVQPTVEVRQPAFRSTDVFSAGRLVAPVAGTVLADTTALVAGVYDVQLYVAGSLGQNATFFTVQHRDSANAANLAAWDFVPWDNQVQSMTNFQTFGYEFSINERLRIITTGVILAGQSVVATIFARRRT